jgi:hypothetical protein
MGFRWDGKTALLFALQETDERKAASGYPGDEQQKISPASRTHALLEIRNI